MPTRYFISAMDGLTIIDAENGERVAVCQTPKAARLVTTALNRA